MGSPGTCSITKYGRPSGVCPATASTRRAQAANPNCAFLQLPDQLEEWGPAMLRFLDQDGVGK